MKRLSTARLLQLPALTILLSALLFSGSGTASASSASEAHPLFDATAQRCDGNRLMHEATHLYRMFYDGRYASAQQIAASTNEYRVLYDQAFAAELRMAAATDQYCSGHP